MMEYNKKNVKRVLVLGSGAIRIGQAGEFDYSGSQAIKALKDEGIKTILINPNIATIQTSEYLADKIYFLPLNCEFVEKIIEKERPDGILLGFGGQTALEVGIELYKRGVLKKYDIDVLGTPIETIIETEDRELFVKKIKELNLKIPSSIAVKCVNGAIKAAERIGYPVMCRNAYALGGLGSGVAHDPDQLTGIVKKAFSFSDQILIEEYCGGWKEIECEVVRDNTDNCIVVCSMENLDPMGIHTGESIVVAPVQTLTASEIFKLRSLAVKVIRHLGIVGECNIQFALDPRSEEYRVIEVNARLSRSSALASKATGYPLAYIASKLALGYSLFDLKNDITRDTSACFEPSLDYVVVKYPRWDLQKFRNVDPSIGSEMKSVGEVMAIARGFEEALQKAVRMLDVGLLGVVGNDLKFKDIDEEIQRPTDKRLFAIVLALKNGYTIEKVHQLSGIDPWFLYKIRNIVEVEEKLEDCSFNCLSGELLLHAKRFGFSDKQIAFLVGSSEDEIRSMRKKYHIRPFVKQIDTLAAEYPAKTNYLYMTYNGSADDIDFKNDKELVVVLGSGPYRIGSSVEFDWCCVNSVETLKRLDYETVLVNCNPETVSTDYDICDMLYFEELSFERVLDICELQRPIGVVVSFGGQISNNLCLPLFNAGFNIFGTSPLNIDKVENRHSFSELLDFLDIDQPEWNEFTCLSDAIDFAEKVGYPVLIRPSYVLSGAAMSVASNNEELRVYLDKASVVNREYPVVISKFIKGGREIEVDGVGTDGEVFCYAVSEHVENAGVHSGDATIVLPPQRIDQEILHNIKSSMGKIVQSLHISGPFNIQFIVDGNRVRVIECNLRASRSFPFVSKVLKMNFVDLAVRVMFGGDLPVLNRSVFDLNYVGVKSPQFSFSRLKGFDPVLGVEMVSTGEVACIGDDFNGAFLGSLVSTGFSLSEGNLLLSTDCIDCMKEFLDSVRILDKSGFSFFAMRDVADFLRINGFEVEVLNSPLEKGEPNVVSLMLDGKFDLVIDLSKRLIDGDVGFIVRRLSVDFNIPLFTDLELAKCFVNAYSQKVGLDLIVKSWDEYN